MTKDLVPDEHQKDAPRNKDSFKGYSMEDLRYQRALVAMRKEFCKSKIAHSAHRIRKQGFFCRNSSTSRMAHAGNLASKVISGLSYLDYVMIGVSMFGTGRKIYKFFRGKK